MVGGYINTLIPSRKAASNNTAYGRSFWNTPNNLFRKKSRKKVANQTGEKEKIEKKIISTEAGNIELYFKTPFSVIKLLKPIAISKDKTNTNIDASHLFLMRTCWTKSNNGYRVFAKE